MSGARSDDAPWGGWTRETIAMLRQLWPTHSAGHIAAEIGATRNAVIGKAHRLGLQSKLPGSPVKDARADERADRAKRRGN